MNFIRIGVVAAMLLATSATAASDYFEVKVNRVELNLYEVLGEGIYVRTRFCFTLALGDDAVVRIDDIANFTIGQIAFVESGDVCDIERLSK